MPPPVPTRVAATNEHPTAFPPVEKPTPTRNLDIAIYQGLLSVFDEMTHAERLEFVELALLFKDLDAEGRTRLVDEANRLRGR